MGEDDAGFLADARQNGEEHVPFEGLCFVDDDECVVEAASANVGERENFEEFSVDHFVDDVFADECGECVEDGLAPGVHFVVFAAGEVSELLAADGVEGAEDDDFAVLSAFEDGFQTGAEGECGFTGSGAATDGDDAERVVGEHVDGDALFCAAPADAEECLVSADEVDGLVRADTPQCRSAS